MSEDLQRTFCKLPLKLRDRTLFGREAQRMLNGLQADLESSRTRRQLAYADDAVEEISPQAPLQPSSVWVLL